MKNSRFGIFNKFLLHIILRNPTYKAYSSEFVRNTPLYTTFKRSSRC